MILEAGLCCCLLAIGLLGCDGVDRAAVFVTPAPVPQSVFPAAEHAPRIRATFDVVFEFAESMRQAGATVETKSGQFAE